MDDMTTPGPNHPANKGIRDRSRDSNRVIDLTATRVFKDITGTLRPIPVSSSHKHEDEAMQLGNS